MPEETTRVLLVRIVNPMKLSMWRHLVKLEMIKVEIKFQNKILKNGKQIKHYR